MSILLFAQWLALLGLGTAALGLALRWRGTSRRPLPVDRSPLKGDPARGVVYALTLGMAPGSKESTRLHAAAYLRGVGFHIAVFIGLAAMAASPFWAVLPVPLRLLVAAATGVGTFLGLAGSLMRLGEANLRALSTADDHFAVALVTLFLALTTLALIAPRFLVAAYIVTAAMLVYIPLGKIRHCLYFFFSRLFFGRFFGRRGVIPHPRRAESRGAK